MKDFYFNVVLNTTVVISLVVTFFLIEGSSDIRFIQAAFAASGGGQRNLATDPNVPLDQLSLPETLPEGLGFIKMEPVGGFDGMAAVFTVTDDGKVSVGLEATLPNLDQGQTYTAWLVKSGGVSMKLGNLEKTTDNHFISANIDGKLVDYQKIVISQESQDDDEVEKPILEGLIK